MQYLDAVSKMTEWALFLSKQTMQYHSNPSLCSKQEYWRSCSWMVLWRPTRPSKTNSPKRCHFHHRGLKHKSRKSKDTWSNGKFGIGVQNEAGQVLTEFYQENAVVIANALFQQHKRRLCTWTSPDGQHWNQIDCILCSQRWRSSIQSAKTRPGADYGSDHELLIAKFRLRLNNVGKTTRSFMHDLNQIP